MRALCGTAAALMPLKEKTIPAWLTAGFAAGVAIAKFISKRIEDRLKAKAAADAARADAERRANEEDRTAHPGRDANSKYFKRDGEDGKTCAPGDPVRM